MKGNFFRNHVSDRHIFLLGLLTLPAFLLQENLLIKLLLAGVFLLLSFISGKKIKLIPVIVAAGSITFLNVLNPVGKILFTVAGFRVTEGALRLGIFRSATVIGLIYLSRFSVRRGLKIPGTYGAMIGKMLYYFEIITEFKGKLEIKKPMESINRIIQGVYGKSSSEANAEKRRQSSWKGIVFISVFVLINWGLYLGNLLNLFL